MSSRVHYFLTVRKEPIFLNLYEIFIFVSIVHQKQSDGVFAFCTKFDNHILDISPDPT